MASYYQVGRTLRATDEHPDGIPCIIQDGDSVLCEFPGSNGEAQAVSVCHILNATSVLGS